MALLIALVTYSSILLHTNHEDSRSHIDPDSHKLVHPTTVIAQSTGLLIGSSTVPMLGHSVSPESASYTLSVLVSTVVYILFAAMHGLTTLMKEKVIIEYGEPVDIYQLSVWLFSYQAAFGFLFSPLIYFLQGVTVGLPLGFPVSAYLVNMRDGLGCLVGSRLSETQFDDFIVSTDDTSTAVTSLGGHSTLNTYTNVNTSSRHFDTSRRSLEDTGKATSSSQLYDMRGSVQCSEHTLIYIFLYVISTVAIIECMARLLQRQGGQPVPLSRVLLVTMLLSCIILGMYDILQGQCDGWFHSHFGLFDIAVVVVMFTGIELFSRESEPDIEIKTHVPFSTAP